MPSVATPPQTSINLSVFISALNYSLCSYMTDLGEDCRFLALEQRARDREGLMCMERVPWVRHSAEIFMLIIIMPIIQVKTQLVQAFSALALLACRAGSLFCCGGILCPVGYLAASLAPTHQMPEHLPLPVVATTVPPALAECLLGAAKWGPLSYLDL